MLNKTFGFEQEYKRISKPTKNAIDNAIRSAKDQADNIVLDIRTEISVEDLKDALNGRVGRSENIKSVWIIRGNFDKVYTREDILSNNFEIKWD